MKNNITIIGAGLAGCEAAWQLANRGIHVDLWEMRPESTTPAHTTGLFGELVCSNSLKSSALTNACGLLKEEMRLYDSLIIKAADENCLPSGAALSVDREKFAEYITAAITSHQNINVIKGEYTDPITDNTIIATGPLTSSALCQRLKELLGKDFLNFFDASAPIVDADSIDLSRCFMGSRYGQGNDDYINCPMTRDEYYAFVDALLTAEVADVHGFEKDMVFEGCMPVEVMAQRGRDTLRFGPLKPTGFENADGKRPFAVVQLRSENAENSMYNLVGFQTHLKFPEQKRIFSMIPGLENANFMRYGVMHMNTYIDSPRLLDSCYSLKTDPTIYVAGQLSGVEGYVESAASGLTAGICAASRILSGQNVSLPKESVIGALASYISNPGVFNFQPMNANFGIVPKILDKMSKAEKTAMYASRSLDKTKEFIENSYWLFN
ncbi:MAG: methylenetetrahydrofolate--tRNA-(uracil(54)-C(5))-methyltransferase (FADH(2)-oxidizing) TrmFO [Clostridiales bacterium]|nr:methylenetetrahydrofolate--tRNA-(uracil(54)-C(5))-methyltransferase (FADH(2)-oxidizing) TrmFO [Clostridiales bacterium]